LKSKELDNFPGKRREVSLKPPLWVPTMPAWLPVRAQEEWQQIVPLLDSMGVLSKLDSSVLVDWCRCVARVEELEAFLDRYGLVTTGRNRSAGALIKNPAFMLLSQYRAALQKYCPILGIFPGRREPIVGDRDDDPHGLLD
jgi:P27 family predicted phage terminase small subunit